MNTRKVKSYVALIGQTAENKDITQKTKGEMKMVANLLLETEGYL